MVYTNYLAWLCRIIEAHENTCEFLEDGRITYVIDDQGEEIAWFDNVNKVGWVHTWG